MNNNYKKLRQPLVEPLISIKYYAKCFTGIINSYFMDDETDSSRFGNRLHGTHKW